MPGVKIGIQLASLRQPLKKALHTAARLGADGVEIDLRHELRPQQLSQTAIRQFRKMLDDLNLRVAAAAFPTRRGYADLEDLERRIAATKSAMEFAYRLGTPVVISRLGVIPDTGSGEHARLVDVLSLLADYGTHVGARLAAQTGDDEGSRLANLLGALPEGAIGVDLHPGRLIAAGHSVADAVEQLGPHVIHVHAADGLFDSGQRRGREVQLGRGLADVPALIAQLEQFDYRGWWTIERLQGEDRVAEIGTAVEYLRNVA